MQPSIASMNHRRSVLNAAFGPLPELLESAGLQRLQGKVRATCAFTLSLVTAERLQSWALEEADLLELQELIRVINAHPVPPLPAAQVPASASASESPAPATATSHLRGHPSAGAVADRPGQPPLQSVVYQEGPIDAKTLPGLPWHLVNLWWDMPATADFHSLDIDVRVQGRAEPSDINLYIAPIGVGQLNDTSFYGGLQTNIGGYTVSPDSPDGGGAYHKGKGCIFSRWGDKCLDTTFVRPAADGLIEAADYEGDFASGRRPYSWGEGAYTFSLRRLNYEKSEDGKEWTWVGAFVSDKSKGDFTYISALKFPGRKLAFWGRHSAFVEIYGGQEVDISKLPPLEIGIGHPRINGIAVDMQKLSMVHPAKGPVSPPIMTGALSADGSEVVFRLHSRLLKNQQQSTTLLHAQRQPA